MSISHGVVLDLGWLDVLRDLNRPDSPNRQVSGFSRRGQRVQDAAFARIMKNPERSGCAELLLFAEQLVLNEFFVIDELALEARVGVLPDELAPHVQRRKPPDDVYRSAAEAVTNLARELWEASTESPALTQLLADMTASESNQFWSGPDKRLHDHMTHAGTALRLVSSAASTGGDTLSRALFYLEFGRHLEDVPLFGPGKRLWLQILGMRLQESLHEVIARRFDGSVLGGITAQVPEAFGATPLKTPPIAELILKKALANGLTLLESASSIRETPEATDYRGLLGELRAHLRQGRSGMLKAQGALGGLDKIAKSWAQYGDAQVGVTRLPRTVAFEKLPVIGGLLKAAGMSEFEIRDRILEAPPGYLAFISSWYREPARS